MKKTCKSAWQTPQLVSFGTIEKITQQNCCRLKQVGPGDGQFLVNNDGSTTAISCVS